MRPLALATLLLGLAAPAFAQVPLAFADVDTDGSGGLSFSELRAVWPNLTEDEFHAADRDGNGELSPEELDALQPSRLPALPAQ